jgi:excisionase family DNA binding protein
MDTKLMTYEQLCQRYGFKRGTVYSLVHEGRIPHIRLGRRFVRFEVEAIDNWIRSQSVSTVSNGQESADSERDGGK